MTTIQLNQDSIGRVLSEDVFDASGRRLLAEGTTITQKSINILESRGIHQVRVEEVKAEEQKPAEGNKEQQCLFATWKQREVPSSLVKICKTQYESHKYDVFLPLKKHENPTDLTLTVMPSEDIIKKGSLFTLPEVYYHISRAISSPMSSAQDIGDAISRDPAFTAKLLQLANSSLYGFSRKISSIYQAVPIIGNQQLAMLSVGIAFTRSFQGSVLEASSMQNFWKHSIATAVTAKYLAAKKGYKEKELFFIGGLLHDIGKLLIYSAIPDSAYILHSLCRSEGKEQQDLERELLGYDHSFIGQGYVESHSLPDVMHEMILFHHAPDEAKEPEFARIIHYADIIANSMKIGSSGQYYVPVCNSDADTIKNMSDDFFETMRKNINSFTKEMMGILLID